MATKVAKAGIELGRANRLESICHLDLYRMSSEQE